MSGAIERLDLSELEGLGALTDEQAGAVALAYYKARAALPEYRPTSRGVKWGAVDWSEEDAEIAQRLGVSRQAVAQARKRISAI